MLLFRILLKEVQMNSPHTAVMDAEAVFDMGEVGLMSGGKKDVSGRGLLSLVSMEIKTVFFY